MACRRDLACDSGSVVQPSILHLPCNGPLWNEGTAPRHKKSKSCCAVVFLLRKKEENNNNNKKKGRGKRLSYCWNNMKKNAICLLLLEYSLPPKSHLCCAPAIKKPHFSVLLLGRATWQQHLSFGAQAILLTLGLMLFPVFS